MSNCVSIKIRNKPNYTVCDKYLVSASGEGPWAGVEAQLCGGNVTRQFLVNNGEQEEVCVVFGTMPFKISGISDLEVEYLGPCTNEDSTPTDEDLYLDLFPGFDLRETKQLTELTEVDTLKFSFTLGFDIPNTENNFNILKTFFNPNVLDNQYNEIEVEVTTGSHVLTESELYVKKCTKDVISVELRLSTDHWARKAKDIRLCQLPYNTVTMGCAHIRDVIENQWPYNVSTDFNDLSNLGIWYPAVNYGRMIQDPTVPNTNGRSNNWIIPTELWRPWFYVTGLLQRGFCALGWQLDSPLFESEFGRKLITYIIDKNYGLEGERKENLKARGSVDEFYYLGSQFLNGQIGTVKFPNIEYDPVSSLDPTTGIYSGSGEVNVRGRIVFNVTGDDNSYSIRLVKITESSLPNGNFFGTYKTYAETEFEALSGTQNDGQEWEWEFEVEKVSVASIERLAIVVDRGSSNSMIIRPGTYLEIEGVRSYFLEGEDEDLQSLIDCSYTFLDLLKGLAHLFNLKFKTNFATRTVEMYQPYDADFWGDSIEGFYIEETVEDISLKIDEKSKVATTPSIETARYQKLLFKDGKDNYIESLELSEPLWSKTIDLGEKFTLEETQESKNPFFEPTANRNGIFANSFAIHTPVMRGETEYGWNFGPRIAIAHGNVIQDFDSISSPKLRYCTYDDDTSELIPTASQHTPIKIGEFHNDENSTVITPEENLVYQVNPEIYEYDVLKSLYHLVYKRWMVEQLNNLTIQYLVDLTNKDYLEMDFRKYYCFYHLGRLVTATIQKVSDYHYCSNILTPVDFIPQKQLSNLCDLLPDNNGEGGDDNTAAECRNNPVLLCNLDGNCYTFTLGGSNNAPIDSVLFEYRLEGSTVWTPLTNITQTSAQLCDMTENFYTRATVSYDPLEDTECPDIVLPEKLLVPCPEYDVTIECVLVWVPVGGGNNFIRGVRTKITLPDGPGVSVLSSQANPNNTGWVNYPQDENGLFIWGDILVGNGNIWDFEIVLQFNSCTPITLTTTCSIPSNFPAPDCSQTYLNLICVENSPGCFVFEKDGVIPFDFDDYVKYRCSDDGINWGSWKVWDGESEICCDFIQGQWFVHFCDDACPFKCSPIVECGGCVPFETDTINQIALCNSGNI